MVEGTSFLKPPIKEKGIFRFRATLENGKYYKNAALVSETALAAKSVSKVEYWIVKTNWHEVYYFIQ